MSMAVDSRVVSDKVAEQFTQFSQGQVISKDGTTIGYRQIGSGPGLVIMHGGARASQHYMKLATALSKSLTVYIPDRRGRGLSEAPGADYSLQKEIDDLEALLQKSEATFVFGHSAGGFFALEAALRLPIDKLALYEPAVSTNGSLPLSWLPNFEQALARNDIAAATYIFLNGLEMTPMRKLPAWVFTPLIQFLLRSKDGREMAELLPTLVWEAKELQRASGNYEKYSNIKAKTLLLGGARSQGYLRQGLRGAAKIIPNSWLVELPQLEHNAPDLNAPELVANELLQFLL